MCPHVMGGQNIDAAQLLYFFRMIECHTKRGACTAVVSGNAEFVEAEMSHDVDLILRHAPERIIAVIG